MNLWKNPESNPQKKKIRNPWEIPEGITKGALDQFSQGVFKMIFKEYPRSLNYCINFAIFRKECRNSLFQNERKISDEVSS